MAAKTRKTQTSAGERTLRLAAEKFAAGPKTWAAMQRATASRDEFRAAERNPAAYFTAQGAKLPNGLMLDVFTSPPRTMPGPDWTPFVIELHACRTFWVRVCDDSTPPKCEFRQETVCFGFRVRPSFPRPGPIPPFDR